MHGLFVLLKIGKFGFEKGYHYNYPVLFHAPPDPEKRLIQFQRLTNL